MKLLIAVASLCFCCCINSNDIIISENRNDYEKWRDDKYDCHDAEDCDSRPVFKHYEGNTEKQGSHSVEQGKTLQEYKDLNNFEASDKEYKGDKYGHGDDKDRYDEYRRQRKSKYWTIDNDEEKAILDKVFGYTGPTANDEPENIIRPCALNDWQCVRKYFAANSKCTPTYGPIPDPLTLDINTVFFPVVNVTVTFPNFNLRGLSSAKINDFYVNKKSGNLVLAIDVQNLSQTTPRAYLRYRRTAKESIVLADLATFSFRSVTFTAVIPKIPNLRLDLADVHVDAQDSIPAFFFGPGAYNSTDPDVITAFSQFPILLPFAVREGFLFQSPLFTAIYIQKNICDFGLTLISV